MDEKKNLLTIKDQAYVKYWNSYYPRILRSFQSPYWSHWVYDYFSYGWYWSNPYMVHPYGMFTGYSWDYFYGGWIYNYPGYCYCWSSVYSSPAILAYSDVMTTSVTDIPQKMEEISQIEETSDTAKEFAMDTELKDSMDKSNEYE